MTMACSDEKERRLDRTFEHDPSYGIPDIAEPAELDADELSVLEALLLLVIDTPVTADALAAATEQPVYRVAAQSYS